MQKRNPEISIIVPIYNTAPYLHRCLESIRNQKFTEFEVILVDDGSTDGSGEIADEFCKKDSRFVVFHKSNGGQSSARNVGLDNVRGNWITFIDSDDSVYDSYLEDLYQESVASCSDIVVSGIENFEKGVRKGRFYADDTLEGSRIAEFITKHRAHLNSNVCEKLFKRDLIENIRFKEGIHNHEDYIFVCEALCRAERISLVSKVNYLYETRGNSQSRFVYDFDSEFKCYSEVHKVHARLAARFGKGIYKYLPLTKHVKLCLFALVHSTTSLKGKTSKFRRFKYKPYEIKPETHNPTFKEKIYIFAIAYKILPLILYITNIALSQLNLKFKN